MDTTKMDTSDWTVEDHISWMRHRAEQAKIMNRLALNVQVTTMVHYDLPWMKGFELSEGLDALDVQRALIDLGPSPVLMDAANRKGKCETCGGTGDNHYLYCDIWPHNTKD